jgi:glycosyltransferase involved in cell wall biosynthesis
MAIELTDAQREFLVGKSFMIGTPCYGGMCTTGYLQSVFLLQRVCDKLGVRVVLNTITNESLVTRARNNIVASFLSLEVEHNDGEYKKPDYLLFIDADIEFEPTDVIRLLVHDKDVVVGAYPLKVVNYNNVENVALSAKEISENVTDYVINFEFDSEEDRANGSVTLHGDLLKVKDAGTGFMMIRREVLEEMIEAYKDEVSYIKDNKDLMPDGSVQKIPTEQYALFDTIIEPETRRYLSEDYTFCRRWQALGGKIWLDTKIVLNHIGTHTFRGHAFVSKVDQ